MIKDWTPLGLTLALAAFSFVLTWAIAIPAGIYSATHQRSWLDYVLTVFNYVGVATPNFLLALVLMWLAFAYFDIGITGLFSSEMAGQPWSAAKVVDLLKHIWLPSLVLAIAGTARLTRVMRANLLDELNKPYVMTARAKGLSEWRVVMRYPVRLAFNPLISTIGWYLPQPDRCDRDEPAQYRPFAASRTGQSGHVPRRRDPVDLLLPDHRGDAAFGHSARRHGSADPDGEIEWRCRPRQIRRPKSASRSPPTGR
jgi:ABC-type amino acid transport system permease subunit